MCLFSNIPQWPQEVMQNVQHTMSVTMQENNILLKVKVHSCLNQHPDST